MRVTDQDTTRFKVDGGGHVATYHVTWGEGGRKKEEGEGHKKGAKDAFHWEIEGSWGGDKVRGS